MNAARRKWILGIALGVALALAGAWLLLGPEAAAGRALERSPAAVAVGPVERGTMERRRVFTGTLRASAEFVVAPKVAARVETLTVDLGDVVTRGQVVATLENEEFIQAVSQAAADLAVAEATVAEATSALEIARREMQRASTLRERGVTSDAQYDEASSALLAAESRLEVAQAQKRRAEAAIATVRIRLGYTDVTANWTGESAERVVAARYLDEGQTVSANEPLLLIVQLDSLTAEVAVTERDYPFLHVGLPATFTTDAFPGEVFDGEVVRLAPVFAESTRQALVELQVDNPGSALKPGMFVRVSIVLETLEDVTQVPEAAVTQRDGQAGVFLVDEAGATVSWVPVTFGLRAGGQVQIEAPALTGRVVTLGQQLLEDGAPITIPESGRRLMGAGI